MDFDMMDRNRADIDNRFDFHDADARRKLLHADMRANCKALALYLTSILPEGREKSLAITKLEETMFWANASLARNA